jgi:hypothetical protein
MKLILDYLVSIISNHMHRVSKESIQEIFSVRNIFLNFLNFHINFHIDIRNLIFFVYDTYFIS